MTISFSQAKVMLRALVKKEIRKSFHKSVLGIFWHLVIPTFQLFIFFTVYGAINQENDLLATVSGLFLWFLFNSAVFPSIQQLIAGKGLITNLKVPAYIIPASSLMMSIIFTSLFVLSATMFMIYYKTEVHSGLLVALLVIFLFMIFTYSVAIVVSIGNIFFRDIGMLWNSFSFLLFLTAPILYPIKILPGVLKYVANVNPITQFIIAIRTCVSQDISTALVETHWLTIISITMVSFLACIVVYKSAKSNLIANL